MTNQPPVPATAPLTTPAVPGPGGTTAANPPIPGQINAAGIQATISNLGQPVSTRKDSTINYEVDKTIRHTKQSIGTIKRLSAAVVINHRKDAKGVMKPLADAELKQINELVKEAMGFNKERGDTVSVANAAFTPVERSESGLAIWKDPELLAMLKELFKYAAIAGILAYLIIKVIRPLLQTMMQAPAHTGRTLGGNVNIVDEETELSPNGVTAFEQKLGDVRGMAQQDPKAVANIIKNWTNINAS